jgi:hypothetical protein
VNNKADRTISVTALVSVISIATGPLLGTVLELDTEHLYSDITKNSKLRKRGEEKKEESFFYLYIRACSCLVYWNSHVASLLFLGSSRDCLHCYVPLLGLLGSSCSVSIGTRCLDP